jgi:hypothetical protein
MEERLMKQKPINNHLHAPATMPDFPNHAIQQQPQPHYLQVPETLASINSPCTQHPPAPSSAVVAV